MLISAVPRNLRKSCLFVICFGVFNWKLLCNVSNQGSTPKFTWGIWFLSYRSCVTLILHRAQIHLSSLPKPAPRSEFIGKGWTFTNLCKILFAAKYCQYTFSFGITGFRALSIVRYFKMFKVKKKLSNSECHLLIRPYCCTLSLQLSTLSEINDTESNEVHTYLSNTFISLGKILDSRLWVDTRVSYFVNLQKPSLRNRKKGLPFKAMYFPREFLHYVYFSLIPDRPIEITYIATKQLNRYTDFSK